MKMEITKTHREIIQDRLNCSDCIAECFIDGYLVRLEQEEIDWNWGSPEATKMRDLMMDKVDEAGKELTEMMKTGVIETIDHFLIDIIIDCVHGSTFVAVHEGAFQDCEISQQKFNAVIRVQEDLEDRLDRALSGHREEITDRERTDRNADRDQIFTDIKEKAEAEIKKDTEEKTQDIANSILKYMGSPKDNNLQSYHNQELIKALQKKCHNDEEFWDVHAKIFGKVIDQDVTLQGTVHHDPQDITGEACPTDFLKFDIWGEVDLCEMHHCAIIKKMVDGTEWDWTKKGEILQETASLVRVILQPYDKEYSVIVAGSHVAIDRLEESKKESLGERLGVIGVTH